MFASGHLIDLSLPLSPRLPNSWPGAVPFRHDVEHWFADVDDEAQPLHCYNGAPYRSHRLMLDEHTGTHFDAPAHFLAPEGAGLPQADPAGAITGDQVPLQQFFGPAVVIDVTRLRDADVAGGTSPRITPEHIRHWESQHGALAAGDVVLFRSHWDELYEPGLAGADAYVSRPIVHKQGAAWPAPSPEAMAYLVERGIRCVGTDGASMGPAEDGAPTHVVGLSAGLVFVECLANLGELPVRGSDFAFLPLSVVGSSGGPGRAVAHLPRR